MFEKIKALAGPVGVIVLGLIAWKEIAPAYEKIKAAGIARLQAVRATAE